MPIAINLHTAMTITTIASSFFYTPFCCIERQHKTTGKLTPDIHSIGSLNGFQTGRVLTGDVGPSPLPAQHHHHPSAQRQSPHTPQKAESCFHAESLQADYNKICDKSHNFFQAHDGDF
jgi:hypothetical protein